MRKKPKGRSGRRHTRAAGSIGLVGGPEHVQSELEEGIEGLDPGGRLAEKGAAGLKHHEPRLDLLVDVDTERDELHAKDPAAP
jgi:hypothetical protein